MGEPVTINIGGKAPIENIELGNLAGKGVEGNFTLVQNFKETEGNPVLTMYGTNTKNGMVTGVYQKGEQSHDIGVSIKGNGGLGKNYGIVGVNIDENGISPDHLYANLKEASGIELTELRTLIDPTTQ